MKINKINIEKLKITRILCFIFFVILISRSHSFFIEYYDRDELANITEAVYSLRNNEKMTWPYGQPANVFYLYSQKIFGKFNWRSLRFIAVFLIFFSSCAVYFAVGKLSGKRSAFLAAFFYSLFMGVGFRDLYVLNSEIIFNFYISLSFMLFVFAEFKESRNIYERILFWTGSLIFAFLAFKTKMHAKFYILLLGIYPFLKIKTNKKRLYALSILAGTGILFLLIDNAFLSSKFTDYFFSLFKQAVSYITSEKLSVKFVITRLAFALIFLFVVQFSVWWLAFKGGVSEKINCLNTLKFRTLQVFFIVSFIPALLTLRMFPHYFIQPLLPASIIAGIIFNNMLEDNKAKIVKVVKIHVVFIFLISTLFYFGLFTAKQLNPNAKVHLQMVWPNKKLVGTIKWIKNNSKPNDRIFVYGDASSIYYFTKRIGTGSGYWLSVRMKSYLNLLNSGSDKKRKLGFKKVKAMANSLDKYGIKYFINTAPSGYSDFERFPLSKFPPLEKFIKNNFKKVNESANIEVYRKIEN